MRALLALVRQHTAAVEADLQRFYGVDLADLWRGALSIRRLSVLVYGLPAESLTVAALNGTDPGWDAGALVTADVFAALTGQPHPARPEPRKPSRAPSLHARLVAQRARLGG